MESIIHVEIDDRILIPGMETPNEEVYQQAIAKFIEGNLHKVAHEARTIVTNGDNTPDKLAQKSARDIENFESAQDTMAQAITAYKVLEDGGIKVHVNLS